jgi:hypothetical protein
MMNEIDAAILRFESAVSRAWVLDTEDSFTDKDRKSTREAHAQIAQRRDELKQAIGQLEDALKTCRDLRTYDAIEINRLRGQK